MYINNILYTNVIILYTNINSKWIKFINVRAKTFNPLGKKTQKSYDKCQKHNQPNEEDPASTKAAKFCAEQTMSAEEKQYRRQQAGM